MPVAQGGAALDREEVDSLLARFPDELISRRDLCRLARYDDTPAANRRLFIATLIWGRGKSNGRMLPGLMSALRSERCDETLRATSELVEVANLVGAYRRWNLPGLRDAFFTKWFWAAAGRRDVELRALVLDGRVWRSLGAIGWDSIDASGSRRRAHRYLAYVECVHRWAEDLSSTSRQVSAEDVEYVLFRANGDPECQRP